MPSFRKGGDSCNSHEMKFSVMPGMGLLIYPSLRTYSTNIVFCRGSIPMYASMFWVTLSGDSTSFRCGGDIGFHDTHMIYVCHEPTRRFRGSGVTNRHVDLGDRVSRTDT